MPLLDALPFLKGAVARSLPGGSPSIYMFAGGSMYAQNAAILASYPMPHILGEFSLAAEDLEKALGRMTAEPTIGSGDGTLVLKSGRLKSEITLMACEPPSADPSGVNGWEPTPEKLMDALRIVEGFISSDGTWQRGAKLEDDRIITINNRHGVEVACPGLRPMGHTVLTDDCVAYLTSIKTAPTEMCLAGGVAWFRWANGAWVRCQLLGLEWPDRVFDQIIDRLPQETPCELTQEWREAFADAAALGDGAITVRPGGMHVRTEHSESLSEIATGATRESYWALATLKPMFGLGAIAWNPDAHTVSAAGDAVPVPSIFRGDGIRGMVAGQRR